MISRTLADHFVRAVHLIIVTRNAFMNTCVVEEIVRAYCAVIAIEVWVSWWAVFAFSVYNVIDLLVGTNLTFQISEVPIVGVMANYALNIIPIEILCLIANTFLEVQVVHLAASTILAYTVFLVLSIITERAYSIDNILQSLIDTNTNLLLLYKYLISSAVYFDTSSHEWIILKSNLAAYTLQSY